MLEDPVYKIAALAFDAGQSVQASGSGAELVREIDAMLAPTITNTPYRSLSVEMLSRLRAALLSGDAAREDAERLDAMQEASFSVLRYADGWSYRIERGPHSEWVYVPTGGLRACLDAAIDRARGGK
jgi:hypothetical protein